VGASGVLATRRRQADGGIDARDRQRTASGIRDVDSRGNSGNRMASLTRCRRRWSAQDGAELIEFALVLPLMLLLLLGILDFGLLFQRYHVVTNAAREGARIAVLPGYADEDVEARVAQFLNAGGLTETPTTTVGSPNYIDVGGQCIVTRPVTVEYPFTYSAIGALAAYFGGGGFTRSGLQATASMRSELSAGACS